MSDAKTARIPISRKIVLAVGIVLAVFVLTVLIGLGVPRSVHSPTASMANTIIAGDHLFVFSRVGTIRRGDIVVFRFPTDRRQLLIKRVVALPGETVEIVGTQVLVNGTSIPERKVIVEPTFDDEPLKPIRTEGEGPYAVYYSQRDRSDDPNDHFWRSGKESVQTVPEGSYYLLGDNRDNSEDSRYFGSVKYDDIVGRPTLTYFNEQGNMLNVPKWLR